MSEPVAGGLDHFGLERLAGDPFDPLIGEGLGLGRVVVDEVVGADLPLEQLLDELRILLQEGRSRDEVRGHELAVRPEVALVDEDLATALLDQAGGPRLGNPPANDLTGLERFQRLRVGLRHDRDVATALGGGRQSLVGEPGAEGDVLGAAQLGRSHGLATQILRGLDLPLDDEEGTRRRGARDDPDRLALGLGKGIDGGVGPDVGGIEGVHSSIPTKLVDMVTKSSRMCRLSTPRATCRPRQPRWIRGPSGSRPSPP